MVAANARWYYSPAYWGLTGTVENQSNSFVSAIFLDSTDYRKPPFSHGMNVLSAFTAIFRESTIYWRFAAIHREAFSTGRT